VVENTDRCCLQLLHKLVRLNAYLAAVLGPRTHLTLLAEHQIPRLRRRRAPLPAARTLLLDGRPALCGRRQRK